MARRWPAGRRSWPRSCHLMMTAQCAPTRRRASRRRRLVRPGRRARPANIAIPGCTAGGDGGNLRSQPEGMCTDTTLDPSATLHLRDREHPQLHGDGRRDRSRARRRCSSASPSSATAAVGFGQPLAALDRALGADGEPPPAANVGFLRPDAYLLIVFISNQDDCSAPAGTSLFSLERSGAERSRRSAGPLTHYRCNHAGHLCVDSTTETGSRRRSIRRPTPPPSTESRRSRSRAARRTTASGALTPVSKFIADIKSLKPRSRPPRSLVAGLVGPTVALRRRVVARSRRRGARASSGPGRALLRIRRPPTAAAPSASRACRLAQFLKAFPNSVLGLRAATPTTPRSLSASSAARRGAGSPPLPPGQYPDQDRPRGEELSRLRRDRAPD